MTSEGSAAGRFQRAIKNRHLGHALTAARELGELSLPHALQLCLLFAEVAPERYPPAAARWHARFVLKAKGMTLEESQLALTALALVPGERDAALRILVGLAKVRGVYVGKPG
jgi:hypothetical protein